MKEYTCIKPACEQKYQSKDDEAYYCPSCEKANKALAAKIDAQIASRPKRKQTSALEEYENQLKQNPMKAGGMVGVHIKI